MTYSSRAAVVLAAAIVLTGSGTLPAVAAPAAARPIDAWAAFAAPDPWVAPVDNVHWYVSTQTITRAMVGKTLVISSRSDGAIDCDNLGAGYSGSASWVSVKPLTSSTCSGSTAVTRFRITRSMVGRNLFLNGWSALGNRTMAIVRASTTVGGATRTVEVTATRSPGTNPVGPLVLLGDWHGSPVSIASGGGVNQIWVGTGHTAKVTTSLDGALLHADLMGNRVDVWTQDGNLLHHWHLDLSSGAITTGEVASDGVAQTGKPGLWVNNSAKNTSLTHLLYAWDGRLVMSLDLHLWSFGFTDDATIIGGSGGLSPANWITFSFLDGRPTATVELPFFYTSGLTVTPDATGATIINHNSGQVCRVEPSYQKAVCS